VYTAQADPADFDGTENGASFKFTVPAPVDVGLFFQNILGSGNYTLEIGVTRPGSLGPINETLYNVALPTTKTEMCNKLHANSVLVITNGEKYNNVALNSCAWANSVPAGFDEQAIIQYAPYGQAVFSWKEN